MTSYNQAIKYAPNGRRTTYSLREQSAVYCGVEAVEFLRTIFTIKWRKHKMKVAKVIRLRIGREARFAAYILYK